EDRRWLLSLADRQFQQQAGDSTDTKLRSLIHRLQCMRIAGTGVKLSTLTSAIASLSPTREQLVYTEAAAKIKELQGPGASKERFHAILGGLAYSDPDALESTKSIIRAGVDEFAKLMESRPGQVSVTKLPVEIIPYSVETFGEAHSDGTSLQAL